MNYHKQKLLYNEIIDYIWSGKKEVKLSRLKNQKEVISELKTIKVIKIDNLDSFSSYVSYGNFLIFKIENNFYFCDTNAIPLLGVSSNIKIIDYNYLLRKNKLLSLENET